jgi:hypothetical protein
VRLNRLVPQPRHHASIRNDFTGDTPPMSIHSVSQTGTVPVMQFRRTTRDAENPSMVGSRAFATGDDYGAESAGTPRWVKVSAVIAVVVVLILVVMLLFGGGPGGHGPGRHLGGDGAGRQAPPSGEARGNTAPSAVREQSREHTRPPPGVEHGPQQPSP